MFFRKNKKKGFTLVEIMVSISILVTILAIVTKLLFDFSKSAYRVSFQMKNTETIRSIFRKIEKQLMNARSVIYRYDIATARSNSITDLREGCREQVSPYGSTPCVVSGKLKSGKEILIVSLPVMNRSSAGGATQDPIMDPSSGVVNSNAIPTYQTVSVNDYIPPIGGQIANYPYKSLPTLGDYKTSDPLDVNRVDSENDVVIIYKDSKKSLRLYQLPSRVLETTGPFINQPFSRYKDDTSYQYKGEIRGSKLAENIEDSFTVIDPVTSMRNEVDYNLFTYYTPTEELPYSSGSTEKGKLVTAGNPVTPSQVAQVLAVRVKITKASDYDVKFNDPIDTTNRPRETSSALKKRIDEKTKETIFRLNRSDTIN